MENSSNEFKNFLNKNQPVNAVQQNNTQTRAARSFITKINSVLKRIFFVAKKQMIKGRRLFNFMFSVSLFLILPLYVEYRNQMLYEYVKKNGGLRRDI